MATKKYPHAVIYKGVLYPAFTEIEVEQEVKTEPKKAVKKNDRATGEKS
jgi:stage V sporulation protein SpoVS